MIRLALNALAKEVLRAGINQMKSGVDYHFDADVLDRQLCILDSGETRVERRGSRQRAETSTRQTPLLIEVGFLTSWVDFHFHFLLIEVDFLTSFLFQRV